MSTEPEPNQCALPANGENETPRSEDATDKEVSYFKKLDIKMRMYLAGLTVTVLCSFIFNVISVSLKFPTTNLIQSQGSSPPSLTMFDAGVTGKVAALSALGGVGLGIGIWIWNFGGIGIWIWGLLNRY